MVELAVWQALVRELEAGRPCALLAVVASKGSSPGRPGALMAVGRDGPLAGSVGGGVAESALVDRVKDALHGGGLVPELVRQVHRPTSPKASGMICGGEQQIAIAPLQPNQMSALRHLLSRLASGQPAAWQLSAAGWQTAPQAARDGLNGLGADWCYTRQAGCSHQVYLVGGGHVSLELSRLLILLGFRVTVIEERAGIGTFEQNRFAHARQRWPYEQLDEHIPAGPRVFVAIMTHAAERDGVALQSLVDRPLGYLGLLGSRSKIHQLLAGRSMPDYFHAPMGLAIHSHSPEEIAVSIAAEMVAVRNGGRESTSAPA